MASIKPAIDVLDSENDPPPDSRVSPKKLHRTTVARRKKGEIQPRSEYREKCMLLSQAQEALLVEHIDKLTKKGFPPNHHQLRVWVANLKGKPPGKNWTYEFVKRHQEKITSEFLNGFDIERKRADSYWIINNYFQLVKEKMEKHHFAPENTYNMDEKGFLIGKLNKTKRIFSHYWKKQGKLQGAA